MKQAPLCCLPSSARCLIRHCVLARRWPTSAGSGWPASTGPIVSEPKFSKAQCAGLKRDLTAYLQTLKVTYSMHLHKCYSRVNNRI